MPEQPIELLLADAAAWHDWLESNHRTETGVWLVLAKKGADAPTTLNRDAALDEALCYGWIDGQALSRDDVSFLQRFTPRRPRSMWSKRNIDIVARLEAEGRMQEAGLAEVERAKADGRWDAAYEGPANIEVPDDLQAALDANPVAKAMFGILTSQNRFAILFRVGQAKREETRVRRIEQFVEMLARGETIYPQKRTLED